MLTAKNVLSLAAPVQGQVDYWDTIVRGLSVRVSSSGHRAYCLHYRFHGKKRRLTLGEVGVLSLADAREHARTARQRLAAGVDPQAEKVAARTKSGTVTALAELFWNANAERLRPSTRSGWRRFIDAEIIPGLGDRDPATLTRGDVRLFVEHIANRPASKQTKRRRAAAPITANRAYEVLRRIFSWAVGKELVATSPCFGLVTKDLLARERPREHTYSNAELRSILAACPGTEVEDLVPLLLHTATRSEETRAMRWAEVDFDRALWTIPAERAKSDRQHEVALSEGALKILRGLKEQQKVVSIAEASAAAFVFPAPTRDGFMDRPGKALVAIGKAACLGGNLRLHDVRRTVADRLKKDLGVAPHVVEQDILGHAAPELAATYMPSGQLAAARAGLEAWAVELGRILAAREEVAAEA
jgi:integrase